MREQDRFTDGVKEVAAPQAVEVGHAVSEVAKRLGISTQSQANPAILCGARSSNSRGEFRMSRAGVTPADAHVLPVDVVGPKALWGDILGQSRRFR